MEFASNLGLNFLFSPSASFTYVITHTSYICILCYAVRWGGEEFIVVETKLYVLACLESNSDVITMSNSSEFLRYSVGAWNDIVFSQRRVRVEIS